MKYDPKVEGFSQYVARRRIKVQSRAARRNMATGVVKQAVKNVQMALDSIKIVHALNWHCVLASILQLILRNTRSLCVYTIYFM